MKYILLLFLLTSCLEKLSNLESLESYLINEWSAALEVEAMAPKQFSQKSSITEPQMTWSNILKVKLENHIDCLFYRVPHRRLSKGLGIIKIIRARANEKCENVLGKKEDFKIKGLSHLKVYFTSRFEKNLISKSEYKPFHLYISSSREGEKDWSFVLPLMNVTTDSLINPNKLSLKKKKYKKYDEPWRDGLYPGLKIINSVKAHKKNILQTSYSEGKIGFCYRVNNECKELQPFECDSCEQGWYSIVDNDCPRGGSKVCGSSNCGMKNEPACPRGKFFEEAENGSFCFRGSKAGFCEEGLETYCDENKVLVCR